jgi:hypothetical protein
MSEKPAAKQMLNQQLMLVKQKKEKFREILMG